LVKKEHNTAAYNKNPNPFHIVRKRFFDTKNRVIKYTIFM